MKISDFCGIKIESVCARHRAARIKELEYYLTNDASVASLLDRFDELGPVYSINQESGAS